LAEFSALVAQEQGLDGWHEARRLLDEVADLDSALAGLYATNEADARTMNALLELPEMRDDGEDWMSMYNPSDFE